MTSVPQNINDTNETLMTQTVRLIENAKNFLEFMLMRVRLGPVPKYRQ
jgi:hypothetical protein